MAIEGLVPPEVSRAPATDVNMLDRAALAMEALRILGRTGDDYEATYDSIRADFLKLGQGMGETYVQLPFGPGFTPLHMLQALDGAVYPNIQVFPDDHTYSVTYPLDRDSAGSRSRRLWLPRDPAREGYSAVELGRLDVVVPGKAEPAPRPPHARLALAGGPRPEEPLLHLLDAPYDALHASWRQPTQLDQLAAKKAEFEATRPDMELSAVNLAGYVMLALQRRIEGKIMPANWGYMVVPQLGRKTMLDRYSCVGHICSYGGQLMLEYSSGEANPSGGIGLSVALKAA